MNEEVAVLEPQADADASPEEEVVQLRHQDRDPTTGQFVPNRGGYVDDSIDTAPVLVEAEAEEVEVAEEPESEVDPSPTDDDAVEEIAEDDPPETSRFQSRIDELTGNFRETQRINDDLQRQLAEANERIAAIPEVREPLKTLEDFDYNGAEYSEYIMGESAKRAEDTVNDVLRRDQAKRDAQDQESAFRKAETEFAKTVKDYNQKVYGEVDGRRGWEASDTMAQEIQEASNGHEMAYYLASNPDKASEIFRMPERRQVKEMDRLHLRLKAEASKAVTEKAKVSNAPPPTPKLKTGGDAGINRGYHEGMSDADFDKMRRKEIANR